MCTYLKDQQGKPQVALGSSIESTIKCPAADEIKTLNQHINQFDADYSHDYQGYHINSASKGLETGSYPSLSAWLKVAKQRLLVIRTDKDQSVDPKNDASSWFQTPQPYYLKDEKPRPKIYLAECIYRFNQGQPQVVLSTDA